MDKHTEVSFLSKRWKTSEEFRFWRIEKKYRAKAIVYFFLFSCIAFDRKEERRMVLCCMNLSKASHSMEGDFLCLII